MSEYVEAHKDAIEWLEDENRIRQQHEYVKDDPDGQVIRQMFQVLTDGGRLCNDYFEMVEDGPIALVCTCYWRPSGTSLPEPTDRELDTWVSIPGRIGLYSSDPRDKLFNSGYRDLIRNRDALEQPSRYINELPEWYEIIVIRPDDK